MNIDFGEKKCVEPFTAMREPIDYGTRADKNLISLPDWIRDFKKQDLCIIATKKSMKPLELVPERWNDFKQCFRRIAYNIIGFEYLRKRLT